MHDHLLPGKTYFGCEQPERPYDDEVCYAADCRACRLAARAAVIAGHGGDERETSRYGTMTLAAATALAEEHYGEGPSAPDGPAVP